LPEVSIITASYNTATFIGETIESVLNQSFQDWEMIIIDDASTDNSIEIIQLYQKKDSRIIYHKRETNGGAALTRNDGIQIAKGRYIAFLDSDDLWQYNKLEEQINFMKKHNLAFSYCSYDIINESGNYLKTYTVPVQTDYISLLKQCTIGCLCAVYDTHVLGKMYMPLIPKRQDYGLWLSILKRISIAQGLSQPLASYRLRQSSISRNKFKAMFYVWKIYRDIEKLSMFESIYYLIIYSMNGIKKYKSLK